MYDAVMNGESVTTIPSGAYFTVTERLTSGQQLWGYVPDFNGYSGWVLLDSNVVLTKTTTGAREILIDPDVGFAIGKSPLFSTDALTGDRTLNASNASMWVDYAGNLHVKGEINATSLFIGDETAEDYMANHSTRIRLNATRLSWASTYSSMTADGVLTCRGATIDGTLVCNTPDTYNFVLIDDNTNTNALASKITMQFKEGRLTFTNTDGQTNYLLGRLSFEDTGFNLIANGNMVIKGNGTMKLTSGGDMTLSTPGTLSLTAGTGICIRANSFTDIKMASMTLDMTNNLEVRAGDSVYVGLTNSRHGLTFDSTVNKMCVQGNDGSTYTAFTGTVNAVYKVDSDTTYWYNSLHFIDGVLVDSGTSNNKP